MAHTDLDEAFGRLFGGPDWEAFEEFAFEYFATNPKNYVAHAAFFQGFTPQWQQHCMLGQYTQAEALWRKAVAIAEKWENAKKGRHIHKGTPFYFWGGTCLLSGDIKTGFALIHEAFNEDLFGEEQGETPADTLPAWCFVILQDENQNQFWRGFVSETAAFLDSFIDRYNADCGRSLTLSDVKTRFLQTPRHREASFFFVYSICEFKHYLDSSPSLNSSFSVLLQLDSVLNVYVVLEDVLRTLYPTDRSLSQLITDFSKTHGIGVHEPTRGKKKPRGQMLKESFESDPEKTISDVLAHRLKNYDYIQTSLAIAPLLRNAAAHRIQSYSALQGQMQTLLQIALDALFTVIDLEK